MITRIKRALAIPLSANQIRLSDSWSRVRSGTRWRFIQETDFGVKLQKELVERHKHMGTGEVAEITRTDSITEWHEWDDSFPCHAKRAYSEGEVWWEDLGDKEGELPPMWGHLMGNGSVWKRTDD